MAEAVQTFRVVCLGGGNAAGYFVRDLLKAAPELKNQIAIISSENYVPYERPALSKGYLLGKAKMPGFATCAAQGESHAESWYAEQGVTLLLGSTATKVLAKERQVKLSTGATVTASDALVLATGCSAVRFSDFNMPGSDLESIYYMRDIADGEKLLSAMEKTQKWCVVGAGYMGMEVAAGLKAAGKDVTMAFPDKCFMERLMPPKLAAVYESAYEKQGINIIRTEGSFASQFEGSEGKATSVSFQNGTKVEADAFFVGIGGRPATSLYTDSGIELASREEGGGVKVNGLTETSVSQVYAIGDLANFPSAQYGRRLRLEHVRCARALAEQCAKVIAGKVTGKPYTTDFEYLPNFYSRVFNLSWEFFGVSEGDFSMITEEGSRVLGIFKKGKTVMGLFTEGLSNEEKSKCRTLVETAATREDAQTISGFLN